MSLSDDDRRLIIALQSERHRLIEERDRLIARLGIIKKELKQLSDVAIAEKFEVSQYHLAHVHTPVMYQFKRR